MCSNCRAFITTDDKVCPYCDTPVAPRAVDVRSPADVMGGLIPHARFTTTLILLINIGLYVATLVFTSKMGWGSGMDPDGRALYAFGAKYRDAISAGQWWRLITAGFLHGGLWHIGMNMWVLFDLGTQVEQVFGTNRYLAFYIFSTITGFLASYYWSAALSIGASAGIFGLIGAMIAMGVRDKSAYGGAVRSLYIRWAMYGLLMGLLPFGIDNAAHIGGIAGGFVLAYVAGTPGYSKPVEQIWKGVAIVAVGATVFAFAKWFLWLTASMSAIAAIQ